MTPRLRTMTVADIAAVIALAERSASGSTWPAHAYTGLLDQHQTFAMVAVSNGDITAFVIARSILDILQLEAIVVDERHRRQGLASALLQAVIAHAQRCNSSRIELEVRAGNQAAIALYQRAGFTPDGRRRNYYQHPPEDALLMSLNLSINPAHTPLPEENPR